MRAWLTRPIDSAGLRAFRVLFGLVLAGGAVRTLASGWIEKLYVEPRFFFTYWGFDFIHPLPHAGMIAVYVALAALGVAIAAGFHTRLAAALFFVGFSYTQLIDVTNYLNHNYLISLLALLLTLLPVNTRTVPAWFHYAFRLQVALVYIYAGLTKLGSDWLLHGEPLATWLSVHTDLPLIGPLLDERWVALGASWAGFLFDTTIVAWLLYPRTRRIAYLVLIGFHTATYALFSIGLFPFVMTAAATVFFETTWARRLLRTLPVAGRRLPVAGLLFPLVATHLAVQIALPLRHLLYPGGVLWNEEGMRFAWKVMVREKHGAVTFHVTQPSTGRTVQVSPHRYLTAKQEREMSSQPDLILQLAHHIADDFRARGFGDVEVRAEALVSLNARPPSPMIDPTVDLAGEHDSLAPKTWILPAPEGPPGARP